MGKILEHGAAYVEMGLRVIPLAERAKRPLLGEWPKCYTTREQMQGWIEQYQDSEPNIGVVCGHQHDHIHLVIVDIDRGFDTSTFSGALWDWLLEHASWITNTPNGGKHYALLIESQHGWRKCVPHPKCDILADGAQVVMPPSAICVDDEKYGQVVKRYEFQAEPVVKIISESALPVGVTELLRAQRSSTVRNDSDQKLYQRFWRKPIPQDLRNLTLISYAGVYRHVLPTLDALIFALREVNRVQCTPPIEDKEVVTIARSAWKYNTPQEEEQLALSSLLPDEHELSRDIPRPPDGLMHDIIDWAMKCSRRPSYTYSLCTAITLMSILVARKALVEGDTPLNVYLMAVGGPGAGKDVIRACVQSVMMQLSLELQLRQSPKSDAALLRILSTYPALAMIWDECGHDLSECYSRRATWRTGIPRVLRGLWSSAASQYVCDSVAAQERDIIIRYPSLTLCGISTPQDMFAGLGSRAVEDGFLSRFVIMAQDDLGEYRVPEISTQLIPDHLFEKLLSLSKWRDSCYTDTSESYSPVMIHISDSGKRMMQNVLTYADKMQRKHASDGGSAELWARCAELVLRLAGLSAFSRRDANYDETTVDECDITWARDMVHRSIMDMEILWHRYSAESERDKFAKQILSLLRKRRGGLTKSQLSMSLRHIQSRMRDEILHEYIEAGVVVCDTIPQDGKGRLATRYRYRGYVSTNGHGQEIGNGERATEPR